MKNLITTFALAIIATIPASAALAKSSYGIEFGHDALAFSGLGVWWWVAVASVL